MSRSNGSQASSSHAGYGTITHQDDDDDDMAQEHTIPATSTAPHPSMYNRPSVKFTFSIGAILLTINLFAFLYLQVLLWHPALPSPFATAPLLQSTLHLISILVLCPALLVFELSSAVTKGIYEASLLFVFVLAILLASIETFRVDGTALSSTPALVLIAFSLLWAILSAKVVASLHADYLVLPQTETGESTPLRISVGSQDAQNQYIRWFKVAVAAIGTIIVMISLLVLLGNVALDGFDAGLEPPGRLLWVDPSRRPCWKTAMAGKIIDNLSQPGPLRLHIGLEASPLPPSDNDALYMVKEGKHKSPTDDYSPWDNKPTAIFFPPAGVSGFTSSHWLRSMVHRSFGQPANETKDGHLAIRRAVWFDPPGIGLSDYVRGSENLLFQAAALAQGLEQLGLLDLANLVDEKDPSPERQFILISLHEGSLLSSVFASLFPSSRIHSQILIDPESATSYYSTDVSAESGLRIGYGAEGRKTLLGKAWNDLLPSLLSYLSPGRIFGAILLGQTSERRLLGSKDAQLRSSTISRVLSKTGERNPFASWFSWEHPAPSSKTLLAQLTAHFEATHGIESSNFKFLNTTSFRKRREEDLRSKPLAILSSFWKMGRDPEGWGEVQRDQFVRLGMEGPTVQSEQSEADVLSNVLLEQPSVRPKKSFLVGWWKVGARQSWKEGGDIGFPEGLCASRAKGRVWCEEAVRKVLSWEEGNG